MKVQYWTKKWGTDDEVIDREIYINGDYVDDKSILNILKNQHSDCQISISNVTKDENVELRDSILNFLHENGYREHAGLLYHINFIVKDFGDFNIPRVGMDAENKTFYLLPTYEQTINTLQKIANLTTGREVSEEEIKDTFYLSEDRYCEFKDWNIFDEDSMKLIPNFEYEPDEEYLQFFENYEDYGYDYEYGEPDYDSLVGRWREQILDTYREILKDFTVYGLNFEEFIELEKHNKEFVIETITENYYIPSEEAVISKINEEKLESAYDY